MDMVLLSVLAQDSGNQGGGLISTLLQFAIIALQIAGMWMVFVKAGQPGWKAIIPFYNLFTQLKFVGRPGWWLLLFFIPVVNLVFAYIISNDTAKSFGKGIGWTLGLFLLGFIFYPLLGFGDARYEGPAAGGGAAATA